MHVKRNRGFTKQSFPFLFRGTTESFLFYAILFHSLENADLDPFTSRVGLKTTNELQPAVWRHRSGEQAPSAPSPSFDRGSQPLGQTEPAFRGTSSSCTRVLMHEFPTRTRQGLYQSIKHIKKDTNGSGRACLLRQQRGEGTENPGLGSLTK